MTPDAILSAVCAIYRTSEFSLSSKSRSSWLVEARIAATLLLREIGMSPNAIGHLLRRDRTSIRYQEQQARERLYNNPQFAERVRQVRERVERVTL